MKNVSKVTAQLLGYRTSKDVPFVINKNGVPFGRRPKTHDCEENAVPYVSDGALGHGFECGVCGAFLQAG